MNRLNIYMITFTKRYVGTKPKWLHRGRIGEVRVVACSFEEALEKMKNYEIEFNANSKEYQFGHITSLDLVESKTLVV